MIIKNSDREEHCGRWLELRRGGLTATEVGQIASGRKSVARVWEEKLSGKTVPMNPFMEWGNLMEPHILDWVSMEFEEPVVANSHIVAWDEDPRCLATPDGFADGAVVEVKTTGDLWEALHDDALPLVERFNKCKILHYYYQTQWQMLICGVEQCLFAWNTRINAPIVVQDGLKFTIDGAPVSDPTLIFTPGPFDMVVMERGEEAVKRLLTIRDKFFSYPKVENSLSFFCEPVSAKED